MGLDDGEAQSFLTKIPIFGGVSESGLAKLCQLLQLKTFPIGTVVCKQGQNTREMFVVRSGEVLLKHANSSGNAVKVVRVRPGDFFGETTLIEVHPSSLSAVVEKPATLYALAAKDLYQLYREVPDAYVMVLNNLARELSRRLRRAEERLCEQAEEADDERTQMVSTVSVKE
jgi:CRP/FNR family cyclic AMP-dependent transcriptional regulator